MKNKELTLQRLRATREKMDTLKPKDFNYDSFVAKDDGRCGTVCCIAGWHPKWFPDAGVKWVVVDGIVDLEGKRGLYSVLETLREFYEIEGTSTLDSSLFIGWGVPLKDGNHIPTIPTTSSLSKVKKHWDRIIKEIENENI